MSSEYTPTIQSVRDGYVWLSAEDNPVACELAGEDFDRFLASVRRDAAREALDGLAAEAREGIVNRETVWGHGQSIASAAETYRDAHYPEETDR